MTKSNLIYWITTGILFLMEGLIPAFTSQTELAKQGISHLGYPAYFGNALVVFKVLGALILILPQAPKRLKEFAYAGFTFNFLFACISHFAVDGMHFQSFLPLSFLALLGVSYVYYHRLYADKT